MASLLALALVTSSTPSEAETLSSALAKAYFNNPGLNGQRASVRVADENVPLQRASMLPQVNAASELGFAHSDVHYSRRPREGGSFDNVPHGLGIAATQSVFDGNSTFNKVRAAESDVFGSRENLRRSEQNVLQSAVQAYMDVLRDTSIVDLHRNQVALVQEELRQAEDQLRIGTAVRTDVAQADAALELAKSGYFLAQSSLDNSIASYRQVIGEQPNKLQAAKPLEQGLPKDLGRALAVAQLEHPSIQAALHAVDAAALRVKVAEAALYPSVNLRGASNDRVDALTDTSGSRVFTTSVIGSVSAPIYDGGASYARIRQAKEGLAAAEFRTSTQRDDVRAAVVSSWGLLISSGEALANDLLRVEASQLALDETRNEARIGEKTVVDVLNAEQTLLDARVLYAGAQRDQVVASYSVVGSMGRLSAAHVGLRVQRYSPVAHFDQVKDKWFGLRTSDGR